MSLQSPERLYRLLPAIHRLRDAGQGEPLRALLALAEAELERVEADIAGLYDNWFIETCEDWVVPYIGELLGVRPLRPVGAGTGARAYVANTLFYRRRKGTAVVLEQLARDVTGWPARAVEFFQRLATTQHVNHVRTVPPCTAALRDAAAAQWAGGAFDPFAHSAEVRHAARGGRHNIPHVGLFLWRLQSWHVGAGTPGDAAPDFMSARKQGGWWSVHPAGVDAPLFNRARTESSLTHLAGEEHVPGPLRPLALAAELERLRRGVQAPAPRFMTALDPVLRVFTRLGGEPRPVEVPREQVFICRLPAPSGSPPALPPRALALDPVRGRIAFAPDADVREVWVQASHGFAGEIGGGPYDRNAALRAASRALARGPGTGGAGIGFQAPDVWQVGVSHLQPADGQTLFASLRAAVQAWHARAASVRTGVIVLIDSLSEFDEAGNGEGPLEIRIDAGSRLLVVAGLWPLESVPGDDLAVPRRLAGHADARQVRAHFVGDLVLRGTAPEGAADAGGCWINGLMLEGRLRVAPGRLDTLELAHCTLLPGHGGIAVEAAADAGNERLRLGLRRSLCAAVSAPQPLAGIELADCIVGCGAEGGGPCLDTPQAPLALERCSVLGGVSAQQLSATDCIFDAPLQVRRRQEGCVRFSYVAPGSVAPRRYRCQPALETAERLQALRTALGREPTAAEEAALRAEVQARLRPLFVSRRFGDPAFGQLERHCPPQIRQGAESGAEMGAFEFLKQPQREANLRDALDEYLRFGLEAGLFHVT